MAIQRRDGGNGRVMIVEDDGLVALMVEEMLVNQGYEIVGIVGDGQAALQAIIQWQPDAIVMDVRLPGLSGIETTRRIQEIFPTPIVILTGHNNPELIVEAGAAGAGAFLVKPATATELARAISIARGSLEHISSGSSSL
jgi:two-component system, response regulator PdtaR